MVNIPLFYYEIFSKISFKIVSRLGKKGGDKVARLLIDSGAEVNKKDSNGTIPIHWASEHGILLFFIIYLRFRAMAI